MNSFTSALLNHYHLTLTDLGARHAPGSFGNLKTPYDNPAFLNVVNRLKQAKAHGEKLLIYGDYDADGLTSTAILYRGLLALGYTKADSGFYIPSRYFDKYGLNDERVRFFHEKGYQIILCVDNGITAFDGVSEAKKLGMEVIIVDHHEPAENLPDTPYLFHQILSGFLDYNCSAASLALFLTSYLRGQFDEYDAVLAGLAVFSDVMPLKGNNLELAKLMLQILNVRKYPNLLKLNGGNSEFTYRSINFSVNPILNAPGRVVDDSQYANCFACSYLLDPYNEASINKFGPVLLNANEKKKQESREFASHILDQAFSSEHCVCTRLDCKIGMVGMYANQQLGKTHLPQMAFAKDNQDPTLLIGSIRVPEPYTLLPFLEKYKTTFVAAGGHERACGLTIHEKDYVKVAIAFATECAKQSLETPKKSKDDAIEISLSDLSEENYREYQLFEPFGEGFKEPKFTLTVDYPRIKANPKILTVSLAGSMKVKCFVDGRVFSLDSYRGPYQFTGSFERDSYNGNVNYLLNASEMKKAEEGA